MKFSIKDFFSKYDQICPNPQFPADLVTFTKENLNGKLHFSCSVVYGSADEIIRMGRGVEGSRRGNKNRDYRII